MAKDVLIHNDNNAVGNAGIVNANHVNLSMFNGVADPLANTVNPVLAQKAGASIPNMFARMIFFSTAFESTQNINALSTYNNMISQCFDLLEMLYNRNDDIVVVPYNFQGQIQLLNGSQNSRHRELAARLSEQIGILGNAVQTIYLFVDNTGRVIGGTSPFTMVFTSPNYIFNNATTPLTQRDAGFKKYVYDMVSSLVATQALNGTPYEGFATYVSSLALGDGRDFNNDGYTMNQFNIDYPDLHTQGGIPITWYNNIALRLRPQAGFTSDFFIKSQLIAFNANTTPLVLTEGDHGNMLYYTGQYWQPHFRVMQAERTNPAPRYLPQCNNAYQHDFVTNIDFFEDKLVLVDYPIDTDHFYCPIDGLDGGKYAMLPLKPFFLQYFTEDDLVRCLNVVANGNQCTFTLLVPVFDGANKSNNITITKSYDLTNANEVFDLTAMGQFGVGISPFFKNANNYWVSAMIDAANYQIKLKFYNHGTEVEQTTNQNSTGGKVGFYDVPQFDFVQIEISNPQGVIQGRCLLMPKFDDMGNNGNQVVAYAIDFGTTNTHIAYCRGGNSFDFDNNDYEKVARYFGKLQWNDQGVLRYADDKLRVLKARQFFPQTTDMQSYDFPIRTALYSSGNQWVRMFCDASIGFHYSKEALQNNSYDTELKWNYLHNIAGAIPRQKILTYMREILWMIKCHWESDPQANHNILPIIGITYPRGPQILNDWSNAYQNIFGQIPNGYLVPMTESLAPCVDILSNNPNIRTQGYVGIDIGGGTTDILYYRDVQNGTISIGDSILFAADDLWGCGFENLGGRLRRAQQVNQFTQLALQQFQQQQAQININREILDITQINKTGKELIDTLFSDQNQSFNRLLSDGNSNNPDVEKGRTRMLIHYSAIVYHLVSWLNSNNVSVPQNIRLSGLGSKYLNMLFPDNNSITAYTRTLINTINGNNDLVQGNFSVQLTQGNPKVVTARGAAREAHTPYNLLAPQNGTKSYGVAGNNVPNPFTVNDVFNQVDNAMIFFNDFIDKYQRAVATNNRPAGIATLDDNAVNQLQQNAEGSIIAIQNDIVQRQMGNSRMDESLFVWTLKDSLWQL